MQAELLISKPDNSIEMGVFWGSSLDFDPLTLNEILQLVTVHQSNTTTDNLLNLHVHTFACPTCPQEIKEEDCLSDGQYCAFFPREGTLSQEELDPEDYQVWENQHSKTISTEFTGRDLLISSLFEKCTHKLIISDQHPTYTEKDFVQMVFERNLACQQNLEKTNKYGAACLMQNYFNNTLDQFY